MAPSQLEWEVIQEVCEDEIKNEKGEGKKDEGQVTPQQVQYFTSDDTQHGATQQPVAPWHPQEGAAEQVQFFTEDGKGKHR